MLRPRLEASLVPDQRHPSSCCSTPHPAACLHGGHHVVHLPRQQLVHAPKPRRNVPLAAALLPHPQLLAQLSSAQALGASLSQQGRQARVARGSSQSRSCRQLVAAQQRQQLHSGGISSGGGAAGCSSATPQGSFDVRASAVAQPVAAGGGQGWETGAVLSEHTSGLPFTAYTHSMATSPLLAPPSRPRHQQHAPQGSPPLEGSQAVQPQLVAVLSLLHRRRALCRSRRLLPFDGGEQDMQQLPGGGLVAQHRALCTLGLRRRGGRGGERGGQLRST